MSQSRQARVNVPQTRVIKLPEITVFRPQAFAVVDIPSIAEGLPNITLRLTGQQLAVLVDAGIRALQVLAGDVRYARSEGNDVSP